MLKKENQKFRVLLVIDLSCSYSRNLLKGVALFGQENENWEVETTFSFMGKDYYQDIMGGGKVVYDGAICFDVDIKMLNRVLQLKIPSIVRGPDRPVPGQINFTTDNLMLCKMAYDYFCRLGFTDFAYCGFPDVSWSTQRGEMMQHILSVHGHQLMVYPPRGVKIPRTWTDEKAILTKWLQDLPKPTAILAVNDFRGKEVLQACLDAGIQVPGDIALLGVDDDECVSPFTRPAMSSIRRSCVKAGYEAAETLNTLMSGGIPERHEIIIEPQEVIARQSTSIFAVNDARVASALQFIHSNKTRPMLIEQVAEHACVHKRVLYNLFKKHTGQTVHEAIRSVRSDHIAHLLLKNELTVSEIAYQVGFDDAGHLSRFFKQAKGMSPTEYRNYHIPL